MSSLRRGHVGEQSQLGLVRTLAIVFGASRHVQANGASQELSVVFGVVQGPKTGFGGFLLVFEASHQQAGIHVVEHYEMPVQILAARVGVG